MPASSAASLTVLHVRVTSFLGTAPGSTRDVPASWVAEAPNASEPVKRLRISAPAALNVLWPDRYSGKGGVTTLAAW